MQKTGEEACSCWTESSLGENVDAIKKCDLSKESKSMAKSVSKCRNSFGTCRKLEDQIGLSIHACTQNEQGLVRKLKNLNKNKVAIANLKSTIDNLLNGTRSLTKDARTITCTTFIEKTNIILSLISQNPSSGKISKFIPTITSVKVSCTTSEKSSLSSLSSSITAAEVSISNEETSVQTTLAALTGTTASTSAIDSAAACEDNCETLVTSQQDQASSSTGTIVSPVNTSSASVAESELKITTKSSSIGGQQPVNMLSTGQKPINMLSTGQQPINMLTVSKQTPVSLNGTTDNLGDKFSTLSQGQKPVNMFPSASSQGQRPSSTLTSIQEQKPTNSETSSPGQKPINMAITVTTIQQKKPTNLTVSETLEDNSVVTTKLSQTPTEMDLVKQTPVTIQSENLRTTRVSLRKGRETVEKLLKQQIKNAKLKLLT